MSTTVREKAKREVQEMWRLHFTEEEEGQRLHLFEILRTFTLVEEDRQLHLVEILKNLPGTRSDGR